jgi:hypothetical protein
MDDDRMERLERRLQELEGRSSAMERALDKAMDKSRAAMSSIMPAETRGHLRAAGREQLLAIRSLLDFWANKLSDETPATNTTGRENIPID